MPIRIPDPPDPMRMIMQLAQLRQYQQSQQGQQASQQAQQQQQMDQTYLKGAAAAGAIGNDAGFATFSAQMSPSREAAALGPLLYEQEKQKAAELRKTQQAGMERRTGITGEGDVPGLVPKMGVQMKTQQQKEAFARGSAPWLREVSQLQDPQAQMLALESLVSNMERARIGQREEVAGEKRRAMLPGTQPERLMIELGLSGERLKETQERLLDKSLLAGVEPGMIVTLADGSTFASGQAALNAQEAQVLNRYVDAKSGMADMRELIDIAKGSRTLTGGPGVVRRGAARLGSMAADILPGPFRDAVHGLSANAYMTLQADQNVDDAVANTAASFTADPAKLGTVEALDFFLSYTLARVAKPQGRLSVNDVKNAQKVVGIKDLTAGSSLIIPRLEAAYKRLERRANVSAAIINKSKSGAKLAPQVDRAVAAPSARETPKRPRYRFNDAGELVEVP